MPAPKRPATKSAASRAAAKSASPAKRSRPEPPGGDPQLELFGRAVAATHQKHWSAAAGLFRRLLERADDDPGVGERARQYLALCEQRLADESPADASVDLYLQAVVAKNRGDFATALALCRRGGRHRRDERMAYLAASILALAGEFEEAADLLAFAVSQNARNRVQAFHDSDFAEVLGRAEFAFVRGPS